MRIRQFSNSFLLALATLLMVAAGAGAETTSPTPRAATGADLTALESLWPKRTGVSRSEPNYCQPIVSRDVNLSATNTNSIEAGPPKFLVEGLEAGATYRHCVFVFNRQKQPRTFELGTLDVDGSLDPRVTLRTEDKPSAVGAWITPALTTLTLQPGERALVPFTLQVPEQPPVGTNVGGVRVTDITNKEGSNGGALVRRSIILQLQVTFPGGESQDLSITQVRAPKFIWRGRDSTKYHLRYVVSNKGTVVDSITPTLRVDGLFGRRVFSVKGTPDVVVPGSAQYGRLRWGEVPWIGRYTPELVVKSEQGTRVVPLPTLWVIPPWPYVAAVGIALLATLIGFWHRRRHSWRQYLEDDDEFEDEPGHMPRPGDDAYH